MIEPSHKISGNPHSGHSARATHSTAPSGLGNHVQYIMQLSRGYVWQQNQPRVGETPPLRGLFPNFYHSKYVLVAKMTPWPRIWAEMWGIWAQFAFVGFEFFVSNPPCKPSDDVSPPSSPLLMHYVTLTQRREPARPWKCKQHYRQPLTTLKIDILLPNLR